MNMQEFELGQLGTNCYLLSSDESDECVAIDAPLEAATAIPMALEKSGKKLAAILLTHGHWDHIWDTAKLAKMSGAKVYAAEGSKELIEDSSFQAAHLFASDDLKSAKIDHIVKDGEILNLAGLEIECRLADGHCPGSIVYYIADESKAFVGDVIFETSVGRADLWGGNFAKLEKSIKEKVYTLPDSTVLFPGHGPSTSVGFEKKNNPFVRA